MRRRYAKILRHWGRRKKKVCHSWLKRLCVLYWWCFIAPLATFRRAKVFNQVKVTLLDETLQPGALPHGIAIVYNSLCPKDKLSADIWQPEWFLMQTMSEHRFRVDRPELLRSPERSTLASIRQQFERLGYIVKELHVSVGSHTVVHFSS